ncbi:MAG: hypothetical protein HC822_26535 [Oscillochloris sp.]|nr:hypothetical protein [Oscillochloris sp.]
MKRRRLLRPLPILLTLMLALAALGAGTPADAQWRQPRMHGFASAAIQGFGDRQNSIAWAMTWWNGYLYVGTGRAVQCVQVATISRFYPIITYPPLEPGLDCADTPETLPLRAEIWRWSPLTDQWQMVFQSPEDVPIPGHPGKYVARDIGFRSFLVYTEPDGSEVLYAAGVSARSMYAEGNTMAPPRLLRSSDGLNFSAVPQDPGTELGDTEANGFRTLLTLNGKLYAVASVGLLGQGFLYVSDNPAAGNASFRRATPPEMTVYEATIFNQQLYVGTGSKDDPFALVRSPAIGEPPYAFSAVIPPGGNLANRPSHAVVALHEFKGQLYVGTDRPAELYRVSSDDRWELIVGAPRWSDGRRLRPLSGMDAGFDWPFNIHMWRMVTFEDQLYVGTMDQTTHWSSLIIIGRLLRPHAGFDLYRSDNGTRFTMLTRDGFGDKYNVGVRNFAVTPAGLFMGSANHYYGFQLWRKSAVTAAAAPPVAPPVAPISEAGARIYLPLLADSSSSSPILFAQQTADGVALQWQPVRAAAGYRIFRAELTPQTLPLPSADTPLLLGDPETVWLPGEFVAVADSGATTYLDRTTTPNGRYHYYVAPLDASGTLGEQSNLVAVPGL